MFFHFLVFKITFLTYACNGKVRTGADQHEAPDPKPQLERWHPATSEGGAAT